MMTMKLSPYCASAGVTVSKITCYILHVVDTFLTNELVYDVEKYCRKKNIPWQEAVKWQKKLFQFDPSYVISEVAAIVNAVKWGQIYDGHPA